MIAKKSQNFGIFDKNRSFFTPLKKLNALSSSCENAGISAFRKT
jgi:hypothetical protein